MLRVDTHRYQWIPVGTLCYQWITYATSGYPLVYTSGYLMLPVDTHRYPWIPVGNLYYTHTAQCRDGDIKIPAGEVRGLLEVCISRRWATICRDEWTYKSDVAVVCRELGYSSGKHLHIFYYMCTINTIDWYWVLLSVNP